MGEMERKGDADGMRGDGRCNRECMHSPVSPEGRTETSTSPRAASTAQTLGALEQARVDRRPGGIPGSASGMRRAADWLQRRLG